MKMEWSRRKKELIITAVICLLVGFIVGEIAGTFATLNWVANKAVWFFEREGNTLNINADELAGALGKYKKAIDGTWGSMT